MKNLYTLLVCLILASNAFAQTFTSTGTQIIRDNEYHTLPITVSGLPTVADSSFGLCNVCLNVVHTYVGDIDLILISPSGDSIVPQVACRRLASSDDADAPIGRGRSTLRGPRR